MFKHLSRGYHALRILGTIVAVAITVHKLLGGTLMSGLPGGIQAAVASTMDALDTWPIYALSLLLAGAWLQDTVDARLRDREGVDTWFGRLALGARLRFTRLIVARPFWYRDEYKLAREMSRADEALARAGFAPLEGLPTGSEEDRTSTVQYLSAVHKLSKVLGVGRAAALSHAIKAELQPSEAPIPAVVPLATIAPTSGSGPSAAV